MQSINVSIFGKFRNYFWHYTAMNRYDTYYSVMCVIYENNSK
jgi:hypothetical protein